MSPAMHGDQGLLHDILHPRHIADAPPNEPPDDVLQCHTGPIFGQVMEERFSEGPPARHTFRGLTSLTEYKWEGRVLTSICKTEGKAAVSTNRRWVAPFEGSAEEEMVVVNEYFGHEGAPAVRYTRTYRRVVEAE